MQRLAKLRVALLQVGHVVEGRQGAAGAAVTILDWRTVDHQGLNLTGSIGHQQRHAPLRGLVLDCELPGKKLWTNA